MFSMCYPTCVCFVTSQRWLCACTCHSSFVSVCVVCLCLCCFPLASGGAGVGWYLSEGPSTTSHSRDHSRQQKKVQQEHLGDGDATLQWPRSRARPCRLVRYGTMTASVKTTLPRIARQSVRAQASGHQDNGEIIPQPAFSQRARDGTAAKPRPKPRSRPQGCGSSRAAKSPTLHRRKRAREGRASDRQGIRTA